MKYVKMLGLLAVAAAALMAVTATASATSLTSGGVKLGVGTEIHAVNENGHVTLANPIANISCSSTTKGEITNAGGEGAAVVGTLSDLTFTGCTNSWHVTAVTGGTLSLNWKATSEASLTSSGAKVDTTRFGVTCVYETAGTPVGTVTDSNKTKATATLDISASIPINTAESSSLCGTGNAKWEGSYVADIPDSIVIDEK
ncbi:MAG TPA: hypothetical protein VFR75_12170 [Solirubrobacterales bacterium]|nr:hypothetical protein [Solirubrobacterales bacterium]